MAFPTPVTFGSWTTAWSDGREVGRDPSTTQKRKDSEIKSENWRSGVTSQICSLGPHAELIFHADSLKVLCHWGCDGARWWAITNVVS